MANVLFVTYSVALLFCVDICDSALDVLSDVLADFLKRFTKLLRIAADAEASQRESRFPVSTRGIVIDLTTNYHKFDFRSKLHNTKCNFYT